jgi:hypothetical protein
MDFPATVTEQVKSTNWPLCSEGTLQGTRVASDSTCNYAYDPSSKAIPYSGGFCCRCPLLSIITGLSSAPTRNNCTAFGSTEAAHCLKFSSQKYSAYAIGAARFDFNVSVKVDFGTSKIQTSQTILSPSNPLARVQSVEAELVGSFAPYTAPPVLSTKIFLRPKPSSSVSQVAAASPTWLLVDPTQITYDGTECNKIGVSYYAFQSQSDRCILIAGSCLANQILHLLNSDAQNVAAGKPARYILIQLGNFSGVEGGSNQTALALTFATDYTTVVNLRLNASQLQFIVNAGVAKILEADLPDFEALAAQGNLTVTVQGASAGNSSFKVSVNCSENIQAIQAKTIGVSGQQSVPVSFPIYAISSQPKNNTCQINLVNAFGKVTDSRVVAFGTLATAHRDQNITSGGQADFDGTGPDPTIKLPMTPDFICSNICEATRTAWCLLFQRCSSQLLQSAIFGGIGALVFSTGFIVLYKLC